MKARTMIYLDSRLHRALREEARAEGISLAELIRRLAKRHLEERESPARRPQDAFMRIVAMGSSGRKDVSERHDAHLGDDLRREHAR